LRPDRQPRPLPTLYPTTCLANLDAIFDASPRFPEVVREGIVAMVKDTVK